MHQHYNWYGLAIIIYLGGVHRTLIQVKKPPLPPPPPPPNVVA
jgi:hypothetical protein